MYGGYGKSNSEAMKRIMRQKKAAAAANRTSSHAGSTAGTPGGTSGSTTGAAAIGTTSSASRSAPPGTNKTTLSSSAVAGRAGATRGVRKQPPAALSGAASSKPPPVPTSSTSSAMSASGRRAKLTSSRPPRRSSLNKSTASVPLKVAGSTTKTTITSTGAGGYLDAPPPPPPSSPPPARRSRSRDNNTYKEGERPTGVHQQDTSKDKTLLPAGDQDNTNSSNAVMSPLSAKSTVSSTSSSSTTSRSNPLTAPPANQSTASPDASNVVSTSANVDHTTSPAQHQTQTNTSINTHETAETTPAQKSPNTPSTGTFSTASTSPKQSSSPSSSLQRTSETLKKLRTDKELRRRRDRLQKNQQQQQQSQQPEPQQHVPSEHQPDVMLTSPDHDAQTSIKLTPSMDENLEKDPKQTPIGAAATATSPTEHFDASVMLMASPLPTRTPRKDLSLELEASLRGIGGGAKVDGDTLGIPLQGQVKDESSGSSIEERQVPEGFQRPLPSNRLEPPSMEEDQAAALMDQPQERTDHDKFTTSQNTPVPPAPTLTTNTLTSLSQAASRNVSSLRASKLLQEENVTQTPERSNLNTTSNTTQDHNTLDNPEIQHGDSSNNPPMTTSTPAAAAHSPMKAIQNLLVSLSATKAASARRRSGSSLRKSAVVTASASSHRGMLLPPHSHQGRRLRFHTPVGQKGVSVTLQTGGDGKGGVVASVGESRGGNSMASTPTLHSQWPLPPSRADASPHVGPAPLPKFGWDIGQPPSQGGGSSVAVATANTGTAKPMLSTPANDENALPSSLLRDGAEYNPQLHMPHASADVKQEDTVQAIDSDDDCAQEGSETEKKSIVKQSRHENGDQYQVDAACIPFGSKIILRTAQRDLLRCVSCTPIEVLVKTSSKADKKPLESDNLIKGKKDVGGKRRRPKRRSLGPKRSIRYLACVHGTGLGYSEGGDDHAEDDEGGNGYSLVLVKASLSSSNSSQEDVMAPPVDSSQQVEDLDVVRYGDVVTIHPSFERKMALGVRRRRNRSKGAFRADESGESSYEIGFYRSIFGQAKKWVVRSPTSDLESVNHQEGQEHSMESHDVTSRRRPAEFQVGVRLSDGALPSNDCGNCNGDNYNDMRRLPLRSGDAIVLHNVYTGGVLSLSSFLNESEGDEYRLALTTIGDGMENVLTIRPEDTWKFILGEGTPTCPATDWHVRRPYLNGTYLLHRKRNCVTVQDMRLFANISSLNSGEQRCSACLGNEVTDSFPTSFFDLSKCPFHVQERVLLDEILSAMMGLEGRYIRACTLTDVGSRSIPGQELTQNLTDSENQANGMLQDKDEQGNSFYVFPEPPSSTRLISFCLCPRGCEEDFQGGKQDCLDVSLTNLLKQMFPLCSAFVRSNAYVSCRLSRYEYGFVARALASALDELLQDYLGFVCQMEDAYRKGKLTMQRLWCHIQPSLRTMRVMAVVVDSVWAVRGGELLNAIHELTTTSMDGDKLAVGLLRDLLEKSSEPYFNMLQSWICTGKVYDPYGEFMVESDMSLTHVSAFGSKGCSWESGYRVRRRHVYVILNSTEVVSKVLTAGKYLNVVLECVASSAKSRQDMRPNLNSEREFLNKGELSTDEMTIKLSSVSTGALVETIEKAFDFAASKLLDLLIGSYSLFDRMESVRRYFLLDQGDFFVQFLDLAEDELLNDVENISIGRVQGLLGMSIQASGFKTDPFRDDLVCDFASEHLVTYLDSIHRTSGGIVDNEPKTPSRRAYGGRDDELRGIEAFMLDYRVEWPVSLILSKRVMMNYQLIFRHLFFAKYVERRLFGTWLDYQMIKHLDLRSVLGKTYCLRQRMLHFMQNFVYYMMFEVIDPQWRKLSNSLKTAQTVDGVLRVHNEFQGVIFKECLLTSPELLRIVTKLMNCCLTFSDQIKLFFQKTGIEHDIASTATEDRLAKRYSSSKQRNSVSVGLATRQKMRRARMSEQTSRLREELTGAAYNRMINNFVREFDSSLEHLVSKLKNDSLGSGRNHHRSHHHFLSNLSTRLDYNEFITKRSLSCY